MPINSLFEGSSIVTSNDEKIKKLAAFFADEVYRSYQIQYISVQYNNEEWIIIHELHKNDPKESGFDGAVYLNTKTGQLVVAFRGTEFTADERGWRDAIKNDVLGFGYNKEPEQYKDAENVLKEAIKILNRGEWINTITGDVYTFSSDPSNLIITGHSLGGGLAQLIGAQDAYKQYEVHTFNAIGVAQMVDNLDNKDGFKFSHNYSNIHNHVISKDFISTIYDHLGEVKIYKPSANNIMEDNAISINGGNNGMMGFTISFTSDAIKLFKGHGIDNFLDQSSFIPEDENFTYQSLCQKLKDAHGGALTEEALAPILTPLLELGFGVAYVGKKIKNIFRPKGVPTGGAAGIENDNPILEGFVSNTDYYYNQICRIFADNDFADVIVYAKGYDENQPNKIILSSLENAVNTIENLKNGFDEYNDATGVYNYISGYRDFEAYYNGIELLYDSDYAYTGIRAYSSSYNEVNIKLNEILSTETNYNMFSFIEIVENDNGDSTVLISKNADSVNARDGYDKYIVNPECSSVRITDSDSFGAVYYGNQVLKGSTKSANTLGLWIDKKGNTYEWNGQNGSTLCINNKIFIEDFSNGKLGINLRKFPGDLEEVIVTSPIIPQQIDPLVIDLEDNGIELIAIDESEAYFDLNADGIREKVQWVSPNDGFLVLDKNSDGDINNIDEVFGNPNTIGFDDLSQYDENNDGVIDENDTKFSQLRVWQDLNSNGVVDDGELTTLTERNIAKINLNYEPGDDDTFAEKSTIEYTNGTTTLIQDINLQVDYTNTKYDMPSVIPDSIKALPQSLGSGVVKDLYTSMVSNPTLQSYMENLVNKTSTEIYNSMDELLKVWTGLGNISNDEMRGLCPEYMVAVVEKFYNKPYKEEFNDENTVTVEEAAQAFVSNYDDIKNNLYTDIIIQSGKLSCLSGINYDSVNHEYVVNVDEEVITQNIKNYLLTANEYDTIILAKVLDNIRREYVYDFDASVLGDEYTDFQKLLLSGKYNISFDYGSEKNDIIVATKDGLTINKTMGSDIYIMKNGDNVIIDSFGSDRFYTGSGNDTIVSSGYNSGDAFVSSGDGDDNITIENKNKTTIYAGSGDNNIDVSYCKEANIYTGDGNNNLNVRCYEDYTSNITTGAGNDVINVYNGNSVISAGAGNDNIIIKDSNSVINFNLGDGQDTIQISKSKDSNKTSVIEFGEGISWDDLEFSKETEIIDKDDWDETLEYATFAENLVISIKGTNDKLTLRYWYGGQKGEYNSSYKYQADKLVFADGSVYTHKDIKGETFIGTDNDDIIDSTILNNIIEAKKGNDIINDPGGDDTYIFNLGDGQDIITDKNGDDTIQFGEGIKLEDLEFYRVQNPDASDEYGDQLIYKANFDDLLIKIKNSDDQIRIKNYYYDYREYSDKNVEFSIETIKFSDGTSINKDKIEELRLYPSGSGTNYIYDKGKSDIYNLEGNTIVIDTSGSDIYNSTSGDVYIVDYETKSIYDVAEEYSEEKFGSYEQYEAYLSSLLGSDTYNLGSGNDTIIDNSSGNDVIHAGAGDDIITTDCYGTLTVYGEDGDDTIHSFYRDDIFISGGNGNDNIEVFNNGNGEVHGDAGDDYIYINHLNDAIVSGGTGNDKIKFRANKLVYNFNLGDGQDVIRFAYQDKYCDSTIKFGEGITWDDLQFTNITEVLNQEEVDLYNVPEEIAFSLKIKIKGTEDSIIVRYWFGGDEAFYEYRKSDIYQIEKFEFADGSTYTKDDIVIIPEELIPPAIEDNIYRFNIGDGQLVIRDYYGSDKLIFGENITVNDLEFYRTEHQYDPTLSNNYWGTQYADDLIIKFKNSSDEIIIMNYYGFDYLYDENWNTIGYDSPFVVEVLEFSDGQTLTVSDVENLRTIPDTDGDDYLVGKTDANTYNLRGNNRVTDFGGNDTYISTTSAMQIIKDYSNPYYEQDNTKSYDISKFQNKEDYKIYLESFDNGNDTYNLGSGNDAIIDQSSGYDLIYTGDGLDSISVGDAGYAKVFAEGGNDSIYAYERDITELYGGDGDDHITVSNGKWSYISGDNGDDTIETSDCLDLIINGGNGIDTINVTNCTNTIIDAGANNDFITAENSTILEIDTGSGNDEIEIHNYQDLTLNAESGDDNINIFNDSYYGTSHVYGGDGVDNINVNFGETTTIDGGNGNDIIDVSNVNNVNIYGGDGDDEIYVSGTNISTTISGGSGNDNIRVEDRATTTLVFNLGDGQDQVLLKKTDTTLSTIRFGEGITWQDLEFERQTVLSEDDNTVDEDNMVIKIKNSSDQIVIKYWFGANNNADQYESSRYYKIDNFIFANGTIYTKEDILEEIMTRSYIGGTNNDDVLYGTSENDFIHGKKGNDIIIDNYISDDTYIFDLGDGKDTITDKGGNDIIKFGDGISQDDIILTKDNNDLLINIKDAEDQIRIKDWALSYDNQIETFKFRDNNNLTNINAQIHNYIGTDDDDTIVGNTKNNIIDGGLGADTMFGDLGDDTYIVDNINDIVVEYENQGSDTIKSSVTYALTDNVENLILTGNDNIDATGNELDNNIMGNSGNNMLSGGNGNDSYIFGLNNGGSDTISDSAGNDRVLFENSVDKSNIAIYQDGNDLIIDYGSNLGSDRITIKNQSNADNAIEKFELSDGSYISNSDINQIIQNMTAYAQNNAIEFTGIDSVKNNADLMNLVASAWHS